MTQGHRRWDKAITTGYENVRRLVHESLIPSLEKLVVLVSRLRGLARFQETAVFGLSKPDLDQVLDTFNCIYLLAHELLVSVSMELRQYSAFSTWMKAEIEAQATDSMSRAGDDNTEKDVIIDHVLVLDYIQGALLNSRLLELFGLQAKTDGRPDSTLANEDGPIYTSFKKDLKATREGTRSETKVVDLQKLQSRMQRQCFVVLAKISETLKRKAGLASPFPVLRSKLSRFDMRAVSEV